MTGLKHMKVKDLQGMMDITEKAAITATKRSHTMTDTDRIPQIDTIDTDHRQETGTETDHQLQDPVQSPSTNVKQGTAATTKRIKNHTATNEPNIHLISTDANFVKKNMKREHTAKHTQETAI